MNKMFGYLLGENKHFTFSGTCYWISGFPVNAQIPYTDFRIISTKIAEKLVNCEVGKVVLSLCTFTSSR